MGNFNILLYFVVGKTRSEYLLPVAAVKNYWEG